MERKSEIFGGIDLSDNQRLLCEENNNLIDGEAGEVEPLRIRYHHFWTYRDIAYGWLCVTGKEPWEFEFDDDFLEVAEESALKEAELNERIVLVQHSNSLAGRNYTNEPEYYEDLIGKSLEERRMYFTSRYLDNLNFLLRANRDKNDIIIFSNSPDNVCKSCRGGVDDVGRHCLEEDNGGDTQLAETLHFLSESPRGNEWRGKLKVSRESIELPISLLFDTSFGNRVDMLAATLPITLIK